MPANPASPSRAPIALFTYRRTDLLGSVLDSLEACPEFLESDVFVFSDGPKDAAAAADVAKVRKLLRDRLRRNMTLIEAPENRGLANSIIAGVNRLCQDYGRAIVIEDDLIVSPALLTWFNAALDRYADEAQVMQVSGHAFDVPALRTRDEALFLPVTTSWGWATWGRAWSMFDSEATGWEAIKSDRALRRRFDLGNRFHYSKMLEWQMHGQVDSWAIRWYWSVFQRGGLVLFPPRSLIANLGKDASGTHVSLLGRLRAKLRRSPPPVATRAPVLPRHVEKAEASLEKAVWRAMKAQ